MMSANKGKHTKPEMAVRKTLHVMGYRFRLHRRDLPGTPDIVFPGRHRIIQVHGCFWHQHEGCRHARIPSTRQEYWSPKLARNKERDCQVEASLVALGWQLITVWECEVPEVGVLRQRLAEFLGAPGGQNMPSGAG